MGNQRILSGDKSPAHDRQQGAPLEIHRPDEIDEKLKASDGADSSSQTDRVATLRLREADGTLMNNISDFTVNTGILLWGQMLSIYYGSLQNNFTNDAASAPKSAHEHLYTYKAAARNGGWKVRRYYSNRNWRSYHEGREYHKDGPPNVHSGWVVCHEDADPLDIIRRVRAIVPRGATLYGNRDPEKIDKVGADGVCFKLALAGDKFCLYTPKPHNSRLDSVYNR